MVLWRFVFWYVDGSIRELLEIFWDKISRNHQADFPFFVKMSWCAKIQYSLLTARSRIMDIIFNRETILSWMPDGWAKIHVSCMSCMFHFISLTSFFYIIIFWLRTIDTVNPVTLETSHYISYQNRNNKRIQSQMSPTNMAEPYRTFCGTSIILHSHDSSSFMYLKSYNFWQTIIFSFCKT